MSKRRNNTANGALQWILYAILFVTTAWLLTSIYFEKSPMELFNSEEGEIQQPKIDIDKLQQDNVAQAKKIQELETRLAELDHEAQFPIAIINIESSYVNMREEPTLSSNIIAKLPDSTSVKIIYYDTETFVLEGKNGKWCRIKYADKEGWVWGNYLEEIDL